MWIILACAFGCLGDDPGAHGRRYQWDAAQAVAGFTDANGDQQEWTRTGTLDQLDFGERLERVFAAQELRFTGQRECLRALRRALPEADEQGPGSWFDVTHYPDVVRWSGGYPIANGTSRSRSGAFACFREGPRVS